MSEEYSNFTSIRRGYSIPANCSYKEQVKNDTSEVLVEDSSGNKVAKLMYKNGVLNGKCLFYENGQLKEEVIYVDDFAEGYSFIYKEGRETEGYVYSHGVVIGRIKHQKLFWEEYDIKTDQLRRVFMLDENMLIDGMCFIYNEDKIRSVLLYDHGYMKKCVKAFEEQKMREFEDQKVIYEGAYEDSRENMYCRQGFGIEYSNDRVVYEGEWKQNKPHGEGVYYLEDTIIKGCWNSGLFNMKDGCKWFDYERRAFIWLVENTHDLSQISDSVHLVFDPKCPFHYLTSKLEISAFPQLKQLILKAKALQNLSHISIHDNAVLECIQFESESYLSPISSDLELYSILFMNSSFSDLPQLQELIIGEKSCNSVERFVLSSNRMIWWLSRFPPTDYVNNKK